jgi:putative ABC transport system substrate-binding protein
VRKLRELGYVEGQNLILDRRSAEGRMERVAAILADLLQLKADVIVTVGDAMAKEAKAATQTVPIVMAVSYDPVEGGIVPSLARPNGNVTGFTLRVGPEIVAKRLQLLKEAVPDASRIAYLATAKEWSSQDGDAVRTAAKALNVTVIEAQHTPANYAAAFAFITRERPHAILIAGSPSNFGHRQLINDFAAAQRIPLIGASSDWVKEGGGLMGYGATVAEIYRQTAGYVDRILKGEKPGDLPIQQPTKYELVINLKTAKALGLTIPPTLLARADEVIE